MKLPVSMALICLLLASATRPNDAQSVSPSGTATQVELRNAKIAARFIISDNGGGIELRPKLNSDLTTLQFLQDQAANLEVRLREGDFGSLSAVVTSDREFLDWLKKNRAKATVRAEATGSGLRIHLIGIDAATRVALQGFIRRIHGEAPISPEAQPPKLPGRDLGKDAAPAPSPIAPRNDT